MKGSITVRAGALALGLILTFSMGSTVHAAHSDGAGAAPPPAAHASVPDTRGDARDERVPAIEAISLDESRRHYALVAAIAVLLAGAAIAFSLPPR